MTVATATQTLEERVEGWANDLCRALAGNNQTAQKRQRSR